MKSTFDPTIDYYGEGNAGHIDALIIGKGALRERLEKNLHHRGLTTIACPTQRELDMSLAPDFVFWIPTSSDEKPKEAFLNFIRSFQIRLVVVFLDIAHEAVLDDCLRGDLDVRLVILHDVYGAQIHDSRLSPVWSNVSSGSVMVPPNDTIMASPLSLDDAVDALCLSAFSSQTYGQMIHVSGVEDITILSFAYKVRDGVMRVTGKSPRIEEMNAPMAETIPFGEQVIARDKANDLLSWKPEMDMRRGIDELLIGELGSKKKINNKSGTTEAQKHPVGYAPEPFDAHRKWKPTHHLKAIGIVLGTLGTFLLLVFAPVLAEFVVRRRVMVLMTTLQHSREQGHALETATIGKRLNSLGSIGTVLTQYAEPGWALIGRADDSGERLNFFLSLPMKTDIEENLSVMNEHLSTLSASMIGSREADAGALFLTIEKTVTGLIEKLTLIRHSTEAETANRDLRRTLSFGRDLLPLAPWALGLDQKRTFALAVENSSELRPTGGFLSAIGFLTIEKGKLIDLSFIDIYQIDSQLTGKEEPPVQIRKVLGESTWLARDANWNPNAPSSASDLERMILRATGRTVDGVIFIPTTALTTILSATGPVTLTTGEDISASNLAERITFGNDVDVQTGKQVNVMVSTLLALKKSLGGPGTSNLFKGMLMALQSGDLVVTGSDPAISSQLLFAGIDGSVMEARCPVQFQAPKCVADSLYVVDANLGVNKVDYFLKRERGLEIHISPDADSAHVLTLRYQNTSPSSTRPGGNYRGYTRVYLPVASTVTSLVSVKQAGDIEVHSDQTIDGEKRVVGFYLDIPYGTESTIKMAYRGSQPLKTPEGIGSYILLWQKQPGISDASLIVTVWYPDTLTPVAVSPQAKTIGNTLLFSLPGDKTETIAAEFASS